MLLLGLNFMNKIKFKHIPNKERINTFSIKLTLRGLYAKNVPTHLNFRVRFNFSKMIREFF